MLFLPAWDNGDMMAFADTAYGVDLTVTEDPGGSPVAWSVQLSDATQFCLLSLEAIDSPNGLTIDLGYADFGEALAALLTAESLASGKGWTYTCEFVAGVGGASAFTLDGGGGGNNFNVAFGNTITRRALGFSANLSGADTYDSDETPYYIVEPDVAEDMNEPSDHYEEGVRGSTAWSRDGRGRSYIVGDVPKFYTFEVWFEPLVKMFKRYNRAATLTWEDFFELVRAHHPFVVVDPVEISVYRNHDRAQFYDRTRRRRLSASNNSWWAIRFDTWVEGHVLVSAGGVPP